MSAKVDGDDGTSQVVGVHSWTPPVFGLKTRVSIKNLGWLTGGRLRRSRRDAWGAGARRW